MSDWALSFAHGNTVLVDYLSLSNGLWSQITESLSGQCGDRLDNLKNKQTKVVQLFYN